MFVISQRFIDYKRPKKTELMINAKEGGKYAVEL